MAGQENFSEFGIDIGLSASGFDSVLAMFKRLSAEGDKLGKSTNEIVAAMKKLRAVLLKPLSEERHQLLKDLNGERDPKKRFQILKDLEQNLYKLQRVARAYNQIKDKLISPPDKPSNGGKDPVKSRFEELYGTITHLKATWFAFQQSMRPMKVMYAWVEGVTQLNMQLRMLHYSSGMAIASLTAYGNTASMYGGSASSISSYVERYNTQIAKARRGLGLGYLQDVAWQFGFGFNPNESAEERRVRAIAHMKDMSDGERLAFAQMEDPAGAKELLAWAERGVEAYNTFHSYMKNIVEGTRTGDGKRVVDAANDAAEELTEAQQKLAAQFKAVKQQFMLSVYPIVKKFVDILTGICEWFNNQSPAARDAIMQLIAFGGIVLSLGGVFLTLKRAIILATRRVSKLFGGKAALVGGNAVAGAVGNAGAKAGAKTAAKVAGGVAGGVAKKGLLKSGGKMIGRAIPGVGLAIGLMDFMDAIGALAKGNFAAAGAHALGGVAGVASTLPGVGTGVSLALTGVSATMGVVADNLENVSTEMAKNHGTSIATTNNNIEGDRNRNITINQTFQSSGNISDDAAIAKEAMSECDALDYNLN